MQLTQDQDHREQLGSSSDFHQADPGSTVMPASLTGERTLPELLSRSPTGWLVIALLILMQWGLFRQFAQREIVWAYPTNNDQVTYLLLSYQTYEQILSQGLLRGLWHGLNVQIPNGVMIHIQASLLFLLIGASRLSALTLNFIYFASFQCILAWTLRWLTGRWSVTLLGVGLLLTATTPFYIAGGLMDFRIDFIAFCLFGILICVVIRSRVFVSWRWSVVVGTVGALLALFRFIAIAYIGGIFGLFFLFVCVRLWFHRREPLARKPLVRQLYGIVIAGATVLIITSPILWHNREVIHAYYVIGHGTSDERELRAKQQNVFTTLDAVVFYPKTAIKNHAGVAFLMLSGLVLAVAVGCTRSRSGDMRRGMTLPSLDRISAYFFVAACVIVPYIILTLDVAKSQVVGDIFIPSLIWLVLLTLLLFSKISTANSSHPVIIYSLAALSAIAICAGIYTQLDRLSRRGELSQQHDDVDQILQLHDLVFHYSRQLGWKTPLISVDRIEDYFDAGAMIPVIYERHGILFDPQKGLGATISAITKDDAINIVKKSDFVLMTVSDKSETFLYPFDLSMQKIRPDLIDFCNKNFVPLQHFHVFNRELILYIRPELTVISDSDGWITSDGLTITGPGVFFQKSSAIELNGKTNFDYLDKVPGVSASLLIPDQTPKIIPANIQRLSTSGGDYRITVNIDPSDIPGDAPVKIHLSFDSYFIPKDIGLSEDTRKLVIKAPDEVRTLR
jgi:hypothetical protein